MRSKNIRSFIDKGKKLDFPTQNFRLPEALDRKITNLK